MAMQCPHCRSEVPAEMVNQAHDVASCLQCQRVFPLGAETSTEVAQVPIPTDISLQRDGSTLVLSWRWFNFVHIFMLFFCLAWDSFLIFWYAIALGSGAPGGMDLIMVIFPLGHVAVGIGLSWSTLAGFLNRTVIRASSQSLSIKHAPIWMPGQKEIPRGELTQLFCREKINRSRNGVSVSYEVNALLKNGQEVKLVSLTRPEQAAFIEQRIESHLGITNRPVQGEMGAK